MTVNIQSQLPASLGSKQAPITSLFGASQPIPEQDVKRSLGTPDTQENLQKEELPAGPLTEPLFDETI
jgi:hypothetical protein